MTSAPADTRERLLDAAELAFAENGIQQASLRTLLAKEVHGSVKITLSRNESFFALHHADAGYLS